MKKSRTSIKSSGLAGLTSQIGLMLSKQGQTVIDLQNKHIKSLGAYIGEFTPSAVKEALLSHNDLSSIDDLDRFKELRRIIANNNYISRVRLALDRLETLDLSNNALTTIPNLAALPKLKVLNLQSNNIREVSIHFVPVSECLEKLYLSMNEIDFYSR